MTDPASSLTSRESAIPVNCLRISSNVGLFFGTGCQQASIRRRSGKGEVAGMVGRSPPLISCSSWLWNLMLYSSKGSWRVSISHSMMPYAYTSASAGEYASLGDTSGATHMGLSGPPFPVTVSTNMPDRPKSATFATMRLFTSRDCIRMFGDFKSRCAINGVAECRKFMPRAMSFAILRTISNGQGFVLSPRNPSKSPHGISSVIM
mmetsp:Transcript_5982/g.15180  ORF Transcript_5982/g.15180 Transcript_5982/m.15180 type:complete len:206 (+) Transcript_5982:932-1549(+)